MEQKSTSLRASSGAGNRAKVLVRDISESLGKLPPQAPDLEEAVLGALMLEKNAVIAVVEFLRPEHFYVEGHKIIYEAIVELFKAGEPVDMRTVVAQLKKAGKLEMVDGAYKIAELTSKVSSAANIEYHARIVIEMAIKRSVIEVASQMHHDAYEETTDVFELLDKVERDVFDISDKNLRRNISRLRDLIVQSILEMQGKKDRKDGLTGVPCGFSALDRITGGWQNSDLIIIAARPGMGKSAIMMSAVRNAAVDFEMPVAVFSLEMSNIQLTNRLLSAEAEIDGEKLRRVDMTEYEWGQLSQKTNKLSAAPIFIDDTAGLTILELRAKCRRLKAEHNIQLVVVDYLQLMKGDKGGNREQEISSICRALKGIAKELNIPLIALSQLSRSVETRGGDKRPQLSDLRESGSIEQEADVVLFLYRPEYYKITIDEDGLPTQFMAEIAVAKHRNGALDTVKLKFIGKYTKFLDWEHDPGFVPSGPTFKGTDQGKYMREHSKNPSEKWGEDHYEEKDKAKPSDLSDEDWAKKPDGETPF